MRFSYQYVYFVCMHVSWNAREGRGSSRPSKPGYRFVSVVRACAPLERPVETDRKKCSLLLPFLFCPRASTCASIGEIREKSSETPKTVYFEYVLGGFGVFP